METFISFQRLRHLGKFLYLFGLRQGESYSLTGDNLRRRGFAIVNWCCMCQCNGETMIIKWFSARRLISCGILSLDLLGSLGFYQEAKTVLELFGRRNWLGEHSLDIWNLVPLCLMWCVLKEHNKHTFEDVETSVIRYLLHLLALCLIGLGRGTYV